MIDKEQLKYEKAHRQHANDTAEQLRRAYNRFVYDVTQDVNADEWIEGDYLPIRKLPRFEARYKAKERVFVKQLLSIYLGAMTVASLRADRKNASLSFELGVKRDELRIKNSLAVAPPNSQKQIAEAKIGGLKQLSERVWKNSKQTRAMIEMSLNVGIKKGMSREAMARSIIKHLQHPDTLHSLIGKRYRGKVPMQVLQHFHPGQGVYRDPYKNAYRLAISEVNNAYRRRDYELGQKNPYLIGWKIQRSQGRLATTCDLCKDLEGIYPKSFIFQGWHPACLCYATQVLADDPKAVRPIAELPKAYSDRYLSRDSVRKPYAEQPSNMKETLQRFVNRVVEDKKPRGTTFGLGTIDKVISNDLANKGIELKSNQVVIDDKTILKYLNHPKEKKGAVISFDRFDEVERALSNPKAIYEDLKSKALVYVHTTDYDKNRVLKVIVHPNYKLKGEYTNLVKSMGVIDEDQVENAIKFFKKIE